uniref:ORF34 n=1 Tax=Nitrosopumilaceae spindle-shaped virus TaxID=3065433 RepID=A0AAT9J779_9VIRU
MIKSNYIPDKDTVCPCGSSKLFKVYPNSDILFCENCSNWFDEE